MVQRTIDFQSSRYGHLMFRICIGISYYHLYYKRLHPKVMLSKNFDYSRHFFRLKIGTEYDWLSIVTITPMKISYMIALCDYYLDYKQIHPKGIFSKKLEYRKRFSDSELAQMTIDYQSSRYSHSKWHICNVRS